MSVEVTWIIGDGPPRPSCSQVTASYTHPAWRPAIPSESALPSTSVHSMDYGRDVLADTHAHRARRPTAVSEAAAEKGLVVEDPASGFCGAIVRVERAEVVLEDRHGNHRVFPLRPAAFLLDGVPVTLVRPTSAPTSNGRTRSASGSVRVEGLRARVARSSRIWVEGVHDAELVERVWGHDLRVEGVVVEHLDGVDALAERIEAFGPGCQRRLGVLVDHLVEGSKESRLVATISDPDVVVAGHPYVDVWQAVRPTSVGIRQWPQIPKGLPWKEGVCAALGWGEPAEGWRRVLSGVRGFRDLETPLVGAVERLIDFVTVPVE